MIARENRHESWSTIATVVFAMVAIQLDGLFAGLSAERVAASVSLWMLWLVVSRALDGERLGSLSAREVVAVVALGAGLAIVGSLFDLAS